MPDAPSKAPTDPEKSRKLHDIFRQLSTGASAVAGPLLAADQNVDLAARTQRAINQTRFQGLEARERITRRTGSALGSIQSRVVQAGISGPSVDLFMAQLARHEAEDVETARANTKAQVSALEAEAENQEISPVLVALRGVGRIIKLDTALKSEAHDRDMAAKQKITLQEAVEEARQLGVAVGSWLKIQSERSHPLDFILPKPSQP